MNRYITSSCVLALLLLSANSVSAGELGVQIVFSAGEIEIIGSWYENHSPRHGHGKKKAKGLPPGIAKNLARGKPLPPGIAKQYLPSGLRDALPPPPKGYERIIVDGKILLVEIATRVIHDILVDVVLR
jgi:hypothetical protein